MNADGADRHVLLSLGAGMQSTALALMAARGHLPLPEAAVFADTGWESAATYAHLEWLMAELDGVLPIHVVRKQRRDGSAAHIRDDALGVVSGRLTRMATPPVFVKGSREYNPCPDPAQQENFVRHVGGAANFVVMPLFARTFTGKTSQLKRQCTGEYKIEPIIRKTRELVGRRRGIRRTKPPFVEMWIGISADEKPARCKPSHEPWITNRWPLRELGMTRRDCERWLPASLSGARGPTDADSLLDPGSRDSTVQLLRRTGVIRRPHPWPPRGRRPRPARVTPPGALGPPGLDPHQENASWI